MNCSLSVSYASALMTRTTQYRNQPLASNKIVAEFGYVLIAAAALIETISRLSFAAVALCFALIDREAFRHAFKILQSSAFSIVWAIVDAIVNPFAQKLVADEKSARSLFAQGKFLTVPKGALI